MFTDRLYVFVPLLAHTGSEPNFIIIDEYLLVLACGQNKSITTYEFRRPPHLPQHREEFCYGIGSVLVPILVICSVSGIGEIGRFSTKHII